MEVFLLLLNDDDGHMRVANCRLVGLVLAGLPVSWQPRPLWKITMATGREGTVTGTVPLQRDDTPRYRGGLPSCECYV